MPDLTLRFTSADLHGDLVRGDLDLVTGDDLKTSIIMSLFTDPGWWADLYEPDAIGCGLSTLFRAKHSTDTVQRAHDTCRDALAWLVEDQVASVVDVNVGWINQVLAIGIVVTQATGVSRFNFEWAEV